MNLDSINQWLWMTEIASEHGGVVNHMLAIVHWVMLVLFVGWTTFLIYVLIRFREGKNPKANYHGVTSHFSSHAEVIVVIVEVVLLLGFAFPLWSNRVENFPKGADVLKVRAVGEQFRWTFHYAGPDGKFGMTRPDLISSSNTIGLDAEDPNSADDFTTLNDLALPNGRRVVVQVTSKDVIHGLALVPFQIQQDAIPGQEIPMWFRPTKIGEWDVVCAQLCGAAHAKMAATVRTLEPEDFDGWFDSQAPMIKPVAESNLDSGNAAELVAVK